MLISIITVNYNNKIGLEHTITSVQSQTYKDIEHIVIDGDSSDGSKDIISKYKDSFCYSVSVSDKGVYHAMNKGIKASNGEYLLFLNSGDHFYSNDSLALFKPYLLKEDRKDILYGNILVKSQKEFIKTYPKKLTFSYFLKDTLPHPASLIKRTCFNDLLYDESLKIVSDWKFFIVGILKRKFTYQYIDKVISTFYLDGISSKNPKLIKQEKEQVLSAQFCIQLKFLRFKQKMMRKLNC